jgi:tetratricopeptide (TPR) repeat protein
VGSRLAVLAAVIGIAIAAPRVASADAASDLVKRGLAEYKAGKYAASAATLEKAYKLDPKPETLFAWAQAERLLGDCEAAIPLYKKLLEQTADLNAGKLVRENLALCEPEPAPEPAVVEPPAPEPEPVREPEARPEPLPPPPAKIIEHRGPGGLAISLIAAGALGIGVGGGFFIASNASADAAGRARTVEDYEDLRAKADSQRTISLVAGGAGVALLAVGIVQAIRHAGPHEVEPTVGVAPAPGGASVWVTTRW